MEKASVSTTNGSLDVTEKYITLWLLYLLYVQTASATYMYRYMYM